MNTTKAAICPKCKQYHLIASIEAFERSKEVRKYFADMVKEGFNVIDTTTDDARKNFGYCPTESDIQLEHVSKAFHITYRG